MLGLLLTVTLVVLFVRQFQGTRGARWVARGKAFRVGFAPIGKTLVADARATLGLVLHPFQARKAARETDMDAELRDLLERG